MGICEPNDIQQYLHSFKRKNSTEIFTTLFEILDHKYLTFNNLRAFREDTIAEMANLVSQYEELVTNLKMKVATTIISQLWRDENHQEYIILTEIYEYYIHNIPKITNANDSRIFHYNKKFLIDAITEKTLDFQRDNPSPELVEILHLKKLTYDSYLKIKDKSAFEFNKYYRFITAFEYRYDELKDIISKLQG